MDKRIKTLLKKLISIPSSYPDEVALQTFVSSYFLGKGYRIRVQHVAGNRANIIVEKGRGKKTILLYSHLDTVAAVPGWVTDPHTPVIKGDRLYGLGAFDMKGGMAVNMETFLAYDPKNVRMRLLFCVDEEYISKGGHAFANSKLMDDVAVVLSPEPAFEHGVNGIVTGRIGRAVLTVRLERPSEHFFYYTPAHDISILAAQIVLRLKDLFRGKNGRNEFAFVRQMHAQSTGMSTPQEVALELDASIVSPHTPQTMLMAVKQIVNEVAGKEKGVRIHVGLKPRETPFLTGYELKKNDAYLSLMRQSIRQVTGKNAIPYFRSSVADENIFGAAGKSVLGVGPVGGNAHGANEWVSLSSLSALHTIYMKFLQTVDETA